MQLATCALCTPLRLGRWQAAPVGGAAVREGATATNPSTGTDANQTNIRRGPSKTIDVSEELPCVSGMAILAHEG